MTKAFDCAVGLLSRREHSAFELVEKLTSKGYNAIEASDAVKTCQDLGLQSDQRFIEVYSRSRIRQGYGPIKIHQELNSRGVDSELISSHLYQEEEQWLEYALLAWQKKSRNKEAQSLNELVKWQRFLLHRGFSRQTIAQVMKQCVQIKT